MIPAAKSAQLTWASGDKQSFRIDGWLSDTRGPRGGILVIESIHIEAALNITTGAGVSMTGADMASFIKRLRLTDVAGDRRLISGFKVRMLAAMDLGAAMPDDPATHAASTTQTDTFNFILQFPNRFAHRPLDYGLAVHDLIGGALEIQMPTASDLLATGGTPTINSGTYVATAYFRELRPNDKQFFVRDVVEEHSQQSNTDLYAYSNGRLVREVWAVKEAASGGTAVTTVTDVTIPALKQYALTRNSLKQAFLLNRVVKTGQDPVYNDKALPLVQPRPDAKIYDFPNVGGALLFKLTSTLTTPDLLVRYIAPKDQRQMEIAAARMGVHPNAAYGTKTKGKSQKDPAKWGAYAAFMPAKAQ